MALIESRSRVVISEDRPLAEVERLSLSERFLVLVGELDGIRQERRAMTEAWAKRQEGIEGEMMVLRRRLGAGGSSRPVECPVLYDFEGKVRVVSHPETGRVVSEEPMTAQDWADARAQGIAPDTEAT